ncbi:AEC family transporter [Parablautia muri]|uniref:AEC family transporter n=1 Tax=Parablautia muri TaxID=2320879 RepID=A0A9X5BEJ7_9FIRM|nr:AEC family transporter [Parablautia muri]NBJ92445.1 AEC family transporter [Parablautia muri]
MDNFLLAAKVVLPLLIYMAVGLMVRKRGIFPAENFKALNSMTFRIFMPLTLFFNIYEAELKEAVRPGIFIFAVTFIFLQFCVLWIALSRSIKSKPDCATMIQGIYRSNFVLFGNVVAASLCGESGLALVAALAALVVPIFNILAVILFELKRENDLRIGQMIINIFKNPLVDAGIFGCIFKLFELPFPAFVKAPLATLGDIATPLALMSLGGMLSLGSMISHRKYLLTAVIGKLIVVPIIALSAAITMGYRGDALVAVLAIFASPTAVASAPMAQSMGGNGDLAGEIVAATSVCCIITIFLLVFFLSGRNLI